MNGKITKALILLALSLTATTGYSARRTPPPPPPPSSQHPADYDQGHGAESHQMMGGYNAPARHDVNGAWDFFIMADFIYWQPRQDNMAIAIDLPNAAGVNAAVDFNQTVIYEKFSWKPGFKVGVGMNFGHDNWGGLVEYTWFHNTHSTSSFASNPAGGGVLLMQWLSPTQSTDPGVPISFSSKWKLGMDLLDFLLQRTHYVGTKLSARVFFGGRATWIDQKFNMTTTLDQANEIGITSFNVRRLSDSWALGPRFGMDLNWMLGWGFSLFSKMAGDISYTKYTKIRFNQDELNNAGQPGSSGSWKVAQLRPHAEAGFGLGWESYFWDNGFHIQFIATYDFNVWWNQNMMRALCGNLYLFGEGHGNLYTHGLDLKVKFDF